MAGCVKSEDGSTSSIFTNSSNWKEHFEMLENYVDGQRVSCSYK